MSTNLIPSSTSTAMANEKKKIRKEFRFIDMIFYTIAAMLGIDTLGAVSSYGGQALFWIVFSAITFLIPYGLLTAELGSTFPYEGSVYEWGKRAFGRFYAALTSMLYWIANPLWIGGTMFVTVIASIKIFWFGNANMLLGGSKISDALFTILISLAFIWATTLGVLLPMRVGKWLAIIGAILKVGLLSLFVLLALAFFLGGHATGEHILVSDLLPTNNWSLIISGIMPVLIFKWVGFEVQNGAGEEMKNPQRDVPRSLFRAGSVAIVSYLVPLAVILFALNKNQIASSSGLMEAINNVAIVLPAGIMTIFKWLMVPAIIITLASSGATWMGGANRTYAIAALDHTAPQAFGRFSTRFGTPIVATISCGLIATVAMLAAVLITSFGGGTAQALFGLTLGFSISMNILAYMFIFPTYIALRYKYPHVKRPYRVPGGMVGAWIVTILTTLYAALAGFFLLFPTDDVIQHSGVNRFTYEATQLTALGVVVLMTIVFYVWGNTQRKQAQLRTHEDRQHVRELEELVAR